MKKSIAAIFAALFSACLLPAATVLALSPAGGGFERSVELFNEGRYREAMFGFMDEVTENPANGEARQYLQRAGEVLLKEERRVSERERLKLFLEAEAARAKLEDFEKRRTKRLADWERQISEVRELALIPGRIQEAVSAYDKLLLKTPVYSDVSPGFLAASGSVKEALYRTLNDKYPGLAAEKEYSGSGGLPGAAADRERPGTILRELAGIRRLEGALDSLFKTAREALRFYGAGKYAEAGPLWRELLTFDEGNEEALLYLQLAAGHLRKVKKESAPADAEDPAPTVASPGRAGSPPAVKAKRKTIARKPVLFTPANLPVQGEEAVGGPGAEEPAAPARNAEAAADDLYEKGVREFSAENYAAAGNYWEECLKLAPGHFKAKLGLERVKREK